MNKYLAIAVASLWLLLAGVPVAWAAGPGPDPMKQPLSQSPYGMDVLGPAWQWTFPREDAWPRLKGRIRVDQLDELFQQTAAAGVRSVRMATWWCILEPERDHYDWEATDYAFQIASNYGIDIVPEIYYTPDWAAVNHNTGTDCVVSKVRNLPPINMEDWSDFMNEFTARYGVMGKNQVHAWEIWNEPDLYEFLYVPWDPGNANVTVYADLVKRARKAIDTYDPGSLLLMGAISDIYGPRFLSRLLDQRGPLDVRDTADVITFHVFSQHEPKIDKVMGAAGQSKAALWATEFNTSGSGESLDAASLAGLYDLAATKGISRTYWFKAFSSDWGPGIFVNRDPLWVPGPFVRSMFFNTFKAQVFPHTVAATPGTKQPVASQFVNLVPTFTWQRPNAGSYPIAGYKLQVENSLYQGKLYFHTPEIDVWVPATYTHFLPLQRKGKTTAAAVNIDAPHGAPAPASMAPAIAEMSYRPNKALAPGVYYWRVAAVDVNGNVGAYSAPIKFMAVAGQWRLYLPDLRR